MMPDSPNPFPELFELAAQIRTLEPWKTLHDQDLLLIEMPGEKIPRVVSILGNAESVFAFHLYRREKGIEFWQQIFESGEPLNAGLLRLDLLECEFLDEEEMDPADIGFQKKHGKTTRRAKGWSLFSAYNPGWLPWELTEEEAWELICAMRLFLYFFDELKNRPQFESDAKVVFPLLRLRGGSGDLCPENWVLENGPLPVVGNLASGRNEDAALCRSKEAFAGMEKIKVVSKSTWEAGVVITELPVSSGGGSRPFYSRVALCVDRDSEFLGNPVVYGGDDDDDAGALQRAVAMMAKDSGILPGTIRVSSEMEREALSYLTDLCGIHITVEALEILPVVLDSMLKMMGPGRSPSPVDDLEEEEPASTPQKLPELVGEERYTLRIDIAGATPPIWRRISVAADATFFHLHLAIQDAFLWESAHLHEFIIGPERSGRRIGHLMIGGTEPDFSVTLREVLGKRRKKLTYIYDFGDWWEHKIEVESLESVDPADPSPQCHAGKRVAPIEDCGGIYGFESLIAGDSEWREEWDPEDLKALREGIFDPNSVTFCDANELWESYRCGGMMW